MYLHGFWLFLVKVVFMLLLMVLPVLLFVAKSIYISFPQNRFANKINGLYLPFIFDTAWLVCSLLNPVLEEVINNNAQQRLEDQCLLLNARDFKDCYQAKISFPNLPYLYLILIGYHMDTWFFLVLQNFQDYFAEDS